MAFKMNNNYKNHKICPIPWHHMSIQQNGDFRICCQNIDKPFGKFQKEGEWFLNAQWDTFEDARNHPFAKEVRKSMLAGEEHPACNLCWKEESIGLNSKRGYMNNVKTNERFYDLENIKNNTALDGSIDTSKFPLNYFDLRFGNLCNLKCRSCGPNDSSLWYEDYYNIKGGGETPKHMWFYGVNRYTIVKEGNKFNIDMGAKDNANVTNDFEWYNHPMFWNQFLENLPNVERLYLTGGEPTINKAHFRLLEICIEKDLAKNIYLEYNTNMYAIPPKMYDLWKHFKHLDIGCSIDGYGDMANYLRPPSTWAILEKNLDVLGYNEYPNIHSKLSTTVSVYNVLNFLELAEWLVVKKFKTIQDMPAFHVLHGPPWMSLKVLPLKTKEQITQIYEQFYLDAANKFDENWSNAFRKYFSGIIAFMNSEDHSDMLPELKMRTLKLDKIRNQRLEDVAPWLAKVLEEVV
jgi:hypothetical protein